MRVKVTVAFNMSNAVALQSDIITVADEDWPRLEAELDQKLRNQRNNTSGFRYSYLVID